MKMTNPICLALVCFVFMAAAPLSVYADRDKRINDRHFWRGDKRVFHTHDLHRWRGGRWVHGHHDHRFGWWWVVGSLWYFYPRVIYPYPYPNPYIPSVVMVPPAQAPGGAPPQYWYYCEAAKDYYPYVPSCAAGWKTIPATPSDAPPQ